jgi:hypothetical protein
MARPLALEVPQPDPPRPQEDKRQALVDATDGDQRAGENFNEGHDDDAQRFRSPPCLDVVWDEAGRYCEDMSIPSRSQSAKTSSKIEPGMVNGSVADTSDR